MAGELFGDVTRRLPNYTFSTLFDVGANVGQTAATYRKHCPSAIIHAFEPVPACYEALVASVGEDPSIFCHQMALGKETTSAEMIANGVRTDNRIVSGASSSPTTRVAVQRGDLFCEEKAIRHINLLKIDTEGFDLEVVVGFAQMLRNHAIDFVQVEVGMNPTNKRHVPFERFVGYLGALGYHLFRLYDQVLELDGRPMLRRSNPVFVSETIVNGPRS